MGNNQSTNNATGFGALPAGYYTIGYLGFGYGAIFWSATQDSKNYAYYRSLNYDYANVNRNSSLKSSGYSVRCLRD